jgi:hypothetical protein
MRSGRTPAATITSRRALSLVERGGEVRSFKIDMVSIAAIWPNSISVTTTRVANGVYHEERAEKALKGFKGKRLTYRGTDSQPAA